VSRRELSREPLILGSDIRPIPGQMALDLHAAGERSEFPAPEPEDGETWLRRMIEQYGITNP
jgi:hypothetical protein